MAEITKERLAALLGRLKAVEPALRQRDSEAADVLAAGADRLEERLGADDLDLDAAMRSAKSLWDELIAFPLPMRLVASRAPGADPDLEGLEDTAETIEIFNEVVKDIGTLTR